MICNSRCDKCTFAECERDKREKDVYRRYYQRHREERLAYQKAYNDAHKEKHRQNERERRARLKEAKNGSQDRK